LVQEKKIDVVKVYVTLFRLEGNVAVVRATKSFHLRKFFKGVEECLVMGCRGPFFGSFWSSQSLKNFSERNGLQFAEGIASTSGDWFNVIDYSRDERIEENLHHLMTKMRFFEEPKPVIIDRETKLLQIFVTAVDLTEDAYVEFLKLRRISLNE
jgi:hypothetical protein